MSGVRDGTRARSRACDGARARAHTVYAVLVPILLENVYVYCTMVQYVYKYYCTPFKVRLDKFAILEKKYESTKVQLQYNYFITYESTLKVLSKVRKYLRMYEICTVCVLYVY